MLVDAITIVLIGFGALFLLAIVAGLIASIMGPIRPNDETPIYQDVLWALLIAAAIVILLWANSFS